MPSSSSILYGGADFLISDKVSYSSTDKSGVLETIARRVISRHCRAEDADALAAAVNEDALLGGYVLQGSEVADDAGGAVVTQTYERGGVTPLEYGLPPGAEMVIEDVTGGDVAATLYVTTPGGSRVLCKTWRVLGNGGPKVWSSDVSLAIKPVYGYYRTYSSQGVWGAKVVSYIDKKIAVGEAKIYLQGVKIFSGAYDSSSPSAASATSKTFTATVPAGEGAESACRDVIRRAVLSDPGFAGIDESSWTFTTVTESGVSWLRGSVTWYRIEANEWASLETIPANVKAGVHWVSSITAGLSGPQRIWTLEAVGQPVFAYNAATGAEVSVA